MSQVLALLFFGAVAAQATSMTGDSPYPSARSLTTKFFNAKISAGRVGAVPTQFFSTDTTVTCSANPMPCSGTYTGAEGAALLTHRFSSLFTITNWKYKVEMCNEAKSLCAVQIVLDGMTKTGQKFQGMQIMEALTWDNIKAKLVSVNGAFQDLEQVLSLVTPAATKHMYRMIEAMYNTKDMTDALNLADKYISDSIVVNLDVTPSSLFNQKTYQGKSELLSLMMESKVIMENLPVTTLMQMGHTLRKMDVLFSDNNMVVVKQRQGKFTCVKKLTFSSSGVLQQVDVIVLTAIAPWDVKTGPVDLFDRVMERFATPFAQAFREGERDTYTSTPSTSTMLRSFGSRPGANRLIREELATPARASHTMRQPPTLGNRLDNKEN